MSRMGLLATLDGLLWRAGWAWILAPMLWDPMWTSRWRGPRITGCLPRSHRMPGFPTRSGPSGEWCRESATCCSTVSSWTLSVGIRTSTGTVVRDSRCPPGGGNSTPTVLIEAELPAHAGTGAVGAVVAITRARAARSRGNGWCQPEQLTIQLDVLDSDV